MSFSHWWLGFFIDQQDYDRVHVQFEAARRASRLSDESQAAISAWRANPGRFEDLATDAVSGALVNTFLWSFSLPGDDQFSASLFKDGGELSACATESKFFRLVSIPRNPPVAVLWHALGYERATRLPGDRGNLL